MNADTLREMIQRRPFEPFCLRLSNGETHEVRHPECAVVGKSKVLVYAPEQDRFVFVALIHVNSVELLQSA
jgi:hypothetical protein